MIEDTDDTTNESILYEVLEHFVRKQEPEVIKSKNDSVSLPTPGNIKNALRYLNNRHSLPESISQQISYTLPWKFAIGDKGRILAVLQENIIEIRKSKDEYSSIIGKASAPKDAFPQWRKLAWSPDGLFLALSSSNGYVSFYNSFGNNIFNISPKSVSQNPDILEAGDATASMIFKKPRVKSETWDYEFIRVTYSGLLKSYCISGNGFSENHNFSFGNFYRNGVNSVSYSEKHNLFFVAGNSVSQNLTCSASQIGLTCWRTLNDYPYYKLSVSSQGSEISKTHFSIWDFIPVIKNRTQSIIFKASLSPNNQQIACLHTDGTISIWSSLTLKLKKQWKLSDQPNYNAVNLLKTMRIKKPLTTNTTEFLPLDIGWWSDNAVIIARYSGCISVCSINNLKNLLGSSPEFLYNYPQIAELDEAKGFLCLDCEVVITSSKRNRESNSEIHSSELSSDSEKDEDETKPVTILNYTTNLMQSALYSITDIQKFQPKRKKSKVFHRTYRLVGLRSTTPEELYSRKIQIEEYEEALLLAENYNLDRDLVYQTQWRKSEFSIDDIDYYLSRVSKRSWVLNECISRVPETLEAARKLLLFGLRETDFQTVVALGMNDNGMINISEALKPTTVESINYNETQKELIMYRQKLFDYLDKLETYQFLLESRNQFDKKFYEEFRQLSPVENAIKFAKKANRKAVEVMFSFYGMKLIPHWLAIMSFFPETINPKMYEKLLPECDIEHRLLLLCCREWRPKDWVEEKGLLNIKDVENSENEEFIYENRRSLLAYRNKEFTQDLLQKWYRNRAYEIEQESRLVDNALALINIGKSRNISNLEKLLFELETLDDLVYKVGLENMSLTEVEKLNDLEKIQLLMTKSDEKNFVMNIKTRVLPYLRRKTRYIGATTEKDLLYDYLELLSKKDLTLPAKFFESFKSSYDSEILDTIDSVCTLALQCIYVCEDIKMYSKAKSIYDATVTHSYIRQDSSKEYKELEKELKCLNILNKYEVEIPLYEVKEGKKHVSKADSLLIKMSENLIKIFPQPTEKNWTQMLHDMLDIQEQAFSCLHIVSCFEISMVARLKSRSKITIQGCSKLMEIKKTGRTHLKVSYERAVDFILQESYNYFNNSKSLMDPDMELAKECLHLVSDDNENVMEEYDLIESLQLLNEFNIDILPLKVRMTQERINLIEDCLNSRNDAYKDKQKLLSLSKYLRIDYKNSKLREGKILNLIARKAFQMKDYNFSSLTVKQMFKNNYQSAWNIAVDLAYCDDYKDLQFQWNCIWYAINNGPSEIIESLMKRANLIKVQILNADLQKWMILDSSNLQDEDKNANTNLTDIFYTPYEENKEFVPKIVQTSTELVKNSAQMFSQSTFDLIKHAGNKEFWKSKLNFNFIDNKEKKIAENKIIDHKQLYVLQKFPCFYETIQENYGISDLDIQYSKYFYNDYNVKLKLCQILLRISLLGETASYGVEISDINHLLLECAKYTITEDCTIGLSYLLHMNDNYLTNIIDMFKDFPDDELYSQLLAYFCSIKLYSKRNPESDKLFLHDPVEIIYNMLNIKMENINDHSLKQLKHQIDYLIQEKQINKNENLNITINFTNESPNGTVTDLKEHINSIKVEKHDEVDDWNNWDDDWSETNCFVNDVMNDSSSKAVTKSTDFKGFANKIETNLSIETYYEIFTNELLKVKNFDEYKNVKQRLLQWFSINNLSSGDDAESNLALKMIIKLANLNINNNDIVLQEIKDFCEEKLVSCKILTTFLQEKNDVFSLEVMIYLQLCSKDVILQKKAIESIKENYKTLSLNTLILEEIFFNNLTSMFSVNHDLYYRVLENVFINRTLPEIEYNVKLLIEKLVDQRNIPHAIALLNQLEGIPPSLSTYGNCFKILLRQ